MNFVINLSFTKILSTKILVGLLSARRSVTLPRVRSRAHVHTHSLVETYVRHVNAQLQRERLTRDATSERGASHDHEILQQSQNFYHENLYFCQF